MLVHERAGWRLKGCQRRARDWAVASEAILASHKAVDDPIGIELLDTYLASYGIVDSMKTKLFQPSFQWYIIYRGETRG